MGYISTPSILGTPKTVLNGSCNYYGKVTLYKCLCQSYHAVTTLILDQTQKATERKIPNEIFLVSQLFTAKVDADYHLSLLQIFLLKKGSNNHVCS